MRAITFLASVVALAAVAGCGQYRPIDPYTGVDLGRSPGVADVQAAYKAAQEMITVSKGNYAEPYFRAFERLKAEQERWLTKPRAGGPLGARLARGAAAGTADTAGAITRRPSGTWSPSSWRPSSCSPRSAPGRTEAARQPAARVSDATAWRVLAA